MGIPMLKMSWSQDSLMINMGIPILVRQLFYIETAPRRVDMPHDKFNNSLNLALIQGGSTSSHIKPVMIELLNYINITFKSPGDLGGMFEKCNQEISEFSM